MTTSPTISLSEVMHTLPGVIAAAKAPEETAVLAAQLLTNTSKRLTLYTLDEWHAALKIERTNNDSQDSQERLLSNLAIAITFLRHKSRQDKIIAPDELALVWEIIHRALTSLNSPSTAGGQHPLFSAARSAQGFLTVPLCSLLNGKDIDELFRLHVWLPDGNRGNPDFAIHSHQPFIQAWILAGEGTDHAYKVDEPTTSDHPEQAATHAEYTLTWKASSSSPQQEEDQNKTDDDKKAYKTHQASSTAINTGKLVRAECTQSTLHKRDTSYTVPAGAHHRSQVSPASFHATLCFFDAQRGFIRDAPALGPIHSTASNTQNRDPDGATPSSLAAMVDSVRLWEGLIEQGASHTRKAELEEGLRCYNTALSLCEEDQQKFPSAERYRHLVEGHMGCMYRRFGRYEEAEGWLQKSVQGLGSGAEFVEFSGELAVVYRHMERLGDAKRVCEAQCQAAEMEILAGDQARRLHFERSLCRAVGNLAMVNYQLYQRDKLRNEDLLDLAINQQLERVRKARELQESIPRQVSDEATKAIWLRDAITWETIGLSRLSLYYSAQGKTKEAVKAAWESLERTRGSEDSTVMAMSHFFYGRALLLDGQHEEALRNFNMVDGNPNREKGGRCTPAMALCKEPSAEHRAYLRQLVDAGADMGLVDEHGYSALDYAVFSSDKETEELIREGMRRNLIEHPDAEKTIARQLDEANLRKGYRTLFQEKLRPVLLTAASKSNRDMGVGVSSSASLQTLRKAYADALAADSNQRAMFDGLKFLRYDEFLAFGRLPRSSDSLAKVYQHHGADAANEENEKQDVKYIIFFSYRWINRELGATSPDDSEKTQFKRMITASELFMERHSEVKAHELGLWIDFACVDQDNPMRGVSALPMILAQCNAVISLVDDEYYTRAWCSVEVMVAQTLAKNYGLHLWYEHVYDGGPEKDPRGTLRPGPLDMEIVMADKLLSFERDRPKVLFLERQSRLLG
ncbi:hypothetical protein V8F20_006448 [Naviculisporaceae sp. PSN 640]